MYAGGKMNLEGGGRGGGDDRNVEMNDIYPFKLCKSNVCRTWSPRDHVQPDGWRQEEQQEEQEQE